MLPAPGRVKAKCTVAAHGETVWAELPYPPKGWQGESHCLAGGCLPIMARVCFWQIQQPVGADLWFAVNIQGLPPLRDPFANEDDPKNRSAEPAVTLCCFCRISQRPCDKALEVENNDESRACGIQAWFCYTSAAEIKVRRLWPHITLTNYLSV